MHINRVVHYIFRWVNLFLENDLERENSNVTPPLEMRRAGNRNQVMEHPPPCTPPARGGAHLLALFFLI